MLLMTTLISNAFHWSALLEIDATLPHMGGNSHMTHGVLSNSVGFTGYTVSSLKISYIDNQSVVPFMNSNKLDSNYRMILP